MPASFVDTNVILYLAGSVEQKAARAEALLREKPVVSVQVLNEIADVLVRKFSWPLSDAEGFLAMVRMLVEVVPMDLEVHLTGIDLMKRHHLSVYDSMIVAAALSAECEILYSEDMQNGLRVSDRLKIRDPFQTV